MFGPIIYVNVSNQSKTRAKVESMSAVFGHLKAILEQTLGPKEYTYVFGNYSNFEIFVNFVDLNQNFL